MQHLWTYAEHRPDFSNDWTCPDDASCITYINDYCTLLDNEANVIQSTTKFN